MQKTGVRSAIRNVIVCAALGASGAMSISAASMARAEAQVDAHYDVSVRIDPVAHKLEGRSVITARTTEELTVVLGRRFEVMQARVGDDPIGPSVTMGSMRAWRISASQKLPRRIEIYWRGELSPLDTSLDHPQTLGRNDPASGKNGTFLPDSSGWYPFLADMLASYSLRIELPPGQRGIVPGRLTEESDTEKGYSARFEFPAPTGGIDLMAGPYVVETRSMPGAGGRPIQLRTYFHSQIADLAHSYLDSVEGYIDLYESWIGHYPFTEFSVVSSPTPTGFGMPTLTYLGVEVLRLPFIRSTSLGHEVLHNWWGNGVYPDYGKGNWSEGLTTFMADYAYKERESPQAAHEMRQGWLRDFAAIGPDQDAPLASFTSRTHGASQIVGYNKAAMMFLMLRDLLGGETFDRALQIFWREQRFRIASWEDLQRAFQSASGRNLQVFFEQWLTRTGAPVVRIADAVRMGSDSSSYHVSVTLEQAEPAYWLRVPVVIQTREGNEGRTLDLEGGRASFTLKVGSKPVAVALDPDLRVFRRLSPEEAPPILRQVMVDRMAETILLPEGGDARAVAETLAQKLQRRAPKVVPESEELRAVPTLVIGLHSQVEAWLERNRLSPPPENVGGKGTAQAWTVSRPDGAMIAVVSAQDVESLGALVRPLPHYGRQSYVVFDGSKMVARGTWPAQTQVVNLD